MCQPCFHHKLNMEEYLQTTEICMGVPWNRQKCAVCAGWVGDLGALSFTTAQQHLHSVFHFGLHLQQKVKEMCDRACCHRREKQQGQSRVQQYSNKVSLACFSPPLLSLSFCLSFSCFDAFPWEQRDGAGRCCCPWCRNNRTEQRGSSAGRFLLSMSLQPKHCKAIQGKALFVHICRIAHVQTDKCSTCLYHQTEDTMKNIILQGRVTDSYHVDCLPSIPISFSKPLRKSRELKMNWAWYITYKRGLKSNQQPTRDLKSLGNVCIRQL